MKTTTFLLVLSLAGNAALGVLVFQRSLEATRAAEPIAAASPAAAEDLRAADRARIFAALESGDDASLIAAGAPDHLLKLLTAARAFERLVATQTATQKSSEDTAKYWRKSVRSKPTAEQSAAEVKAQNEWYRAMRQAFGDDVLDGSFSDRRYAFLPIATRERLRRIEEDYNEMRTDIFRQGADIMLPSDQAKLKLLDEEHLRDVQAAMTPQEREQYELRSSPASETVRNNWGDAIQSEDQFKRILGLQKAFDEDFSVERYAMGPIPDDAVKARAAAAQELENKIRGVLGDENYAAAKQDTDPDYRTLTALASRLDLPTGVPEQTFAYRELYAERSRAINANAQLSARERQTQIMELAVQAKKDLAATLGDEGVNVYANSSRWLQLLQEGTPFTTDPKLGDMNASFGPAGAYPLRR